MQLSNRLSRAELFFIIISVALSGLVLVGTRGLPPAFFEPLGPAAFPKFIAIIVIGLSIIKGISMLITSEFTADDKSSITAELLQRKTTFFALLLISTYAFFLSYRVLDFRIVTAIFLLLLVHLLKSETNAKGSLVIIIYSASLSFFMYFVFTNIFYLNI